MLVFPTWKFLNLAEKEKQNVKRKKAVLIF
jgi:hypothetical protein